MEVQGARGQPSSGRPVRPLLVDPSGRGGIVRYTERLAAALVLVGARPTVLMCRSVRGGRHDCPVRRWLPRQRWGRPRRRIAWPAFYAGRASAWVSSAIAVEVATRRTHADVVHFQAPIHRRLDVGLVRHISRHLAVIWTAHDVLPHEPAVGDEAVFTSIYRAADLVIVHGQIAAQEVRRMAQVEPAVIAHVPVGAPRVDAADARRRLGLPPDERILGALGFIRSYKGYDLLADVWERLGTSAPLLLVIGDVVDEPGRQALERLERCDRTIVWAGYASDADLHLAISAVDAVLLPYVDASDSGILHSGRAAGVPVLASDAPQLASLVRETNAGSVLPRRVAVWAEAVTGPLPNAPPEPPTSEAIGRAHLDAYEEALRRARRRRLDPGSM
jgi:D-inositol-3-phosphate glycosyltransferase